MNKIKVFKVTDGQETWIYEDIETALNHVKQDVLDVVFGSAEEGDSWIIEVAYMSQEDLDAVPEV